MRVRRKGAARDDDPFRRPGIDGDRPRGRRAGHQRLCVREAALIRAVLDEVDTVEEAIHTAHDLLAVAREVRRLADVDPPGPPRANADRRKTHRP
jgi:hypothetical protein